MSDNLGVVPANAGTHSPCASCFARSKNSSPLVVSVPLRRMDPRVRGDDQPKSGRLMQINGAS